MYSNWLFLLNPLNYFVCIVFFSTKHLCGRRTATVCVPVPCRCANFPYWCVQRRLPCYKICSEICGACIIRESDLSRMCCRFEKKFMSAPGQQIFKNPIPTYSVSLFGKLQFTLINTIYFFCPHHLAIILKGPELSPRLLVLVLVKKYCIYRQLLN